MRLGSARVSRAGERVLAVANFLTATQPVKILALEKASFGATPKPARETRALPGNQDSIRGKSGTGLPTTCPSGNLPHSASASEKRSSFPLNSIFHLS